MLIGLRAGTESSTKFCFMDAMVCVIKLMGSLDLLRVLEQCIGFGPEHNNFMMQNNIVVEFKIMKSVRGLDLKFIGTWVV